MSGWEDERRMRLSALTSGFDIDAGPVDPEITAITEDSRRVVPGTLFVAVRGTTEDGHRYIGEAVQRGAVAVAGEDATAAVNVPFVRMKSSRHGLAELATRFFDHPARELRLIGFTGTFGKTSTSDVLRQLLAAGGARPGVLGSLGARFGEFHDPGHGLTTPAPVEMHRALRGLRAAGGDTVIIEVTSHALRLGRADGLTFDGGLIAAVLPGEHTDFHRSYDDYVAAKRLFLDYLSPQATLAYDGDNHASRMLAHEARVGSRSGFSLGGVPTRRTGPSSPETLVLTNIAVDASGARFTIRGVRMHSPLLGRGHLRNVALAVAYAHTDGLSLEVARRVLRGLKPLRRRMERYEASRRTVLDDTAGHPDSLRATLEVAAMLRRAQEPANTVVVYAIRGNRGTDINRRNATALADLAAEHGITDVIVTASADVAGPNDRATVDEVESTRAALSARGQRFDFHDSLETAARAALDRSAAGDLLVLVGAQGMNEGRRFLLQ